MKLVYFDLETTDVDINTAEIIQIAAIAMDGEREISTFNRLLAFDVMKAKKEALALNHYSADEWEAEAIPPLNGMLEFCSWARPYLDQERVSKRTGRPFMVGTLCGYNAARFDFPILQRTCKEHGVFLPFDFRVRDAMLVALSVCDFLGEAPKDFELATVAEHFGAPVEEAHDALSDVRTTVALMRRFRDIFVSAKAAA